MKRIIKLTILLLTFLMPVITSAHDLEVDGIYYNISGNEATVTYQGTTHYEYDEYSGNVTIPSSVNYNGRYYTVTAIGKDAFRNCTELTNVTMPNSMTSIGSYAFYNCTKLASVTIPNSVTAIGNYAFYDCSKLTSINIPNSVTNIGNYAFYGCSALTSIDIPNSVTTLGKGVFEYCSALTSIDIPNSVTNIDNYAFYGCSALTSIDIPNSVTNIDNYAFYGCSALTSIDIPNSVTNIDNYAFYGCSALTSIDIPNSITNIGEGVFNGCSALTSIDFPNSITNIGIKAFYNCSGLTSINIPNSVTNIGNSAFYGCSGLTSIDFPNSVTNIGNYAFANCSSLTDVYSSIENPSVISMGDNVFYLNNEDYSNRRLHVPLGSIPAYRVGRKWSTYFATIEDGDTVVAIGLTGEILITEGGNEVNSDHTSINYDQLWISYTGDEDVEFTILVNKSICISGGVPHQKYPESYEDTYVLLNDDYLSQYISWDSLNNRYIVDLYSFVFEELFHPYDPEYSIEYYDISGTFHFLVSVHASGYNDLSGEYTVYSSHDSVDPNGPFPPEISSLGYSDLTTFVIVSYDCSIHYSSSDQGYLIHEAINEVGIRGEYGYDIYACKRKDEDYYVTVSATQRSAPEGMYWGKTSKTILIPARECSISISRFLDNEPQSEYFNYCYGNVVDVDGERVEYGEKESYAVVDFNKWRKLYGNIWDYGVYYDDDSWDCWNFKHHIKIDGQLVDGYFLDDTLSYVIDLLPYGDAFGGERHIEVIATEKYNSLSVDTVLTYHPIETKLTYNSLIIDVNSGKGGFNLFIDGEEVELSTEGNDLPAHIYALPRLDHDYSVTVQVGNNLYIDENGNLSVVYTGLSQETTIIVPAKQIFDFEIDSIYYKVKNDNEDEVEVAHGENAYQGIINIPTNVTYNGVTYDVTGISDGAFTDATLQSLILPASITSIGNTAFTNCHINSLVISGNGTWSAGAINCEVDNLYVMSTVTGIQDLQVNPATTVYSYSTLPPTCNEQTFTGYDAALHVPASALAAYFTAPYWNNFINITSDAVEPTGLTINKDSVEVLVGNQLTLTATAIPTDATPNEILWTSSDKSIATITNGVITAMHVGECDITAYLLDKTAVCHLTVTEIAPTQITLNQEFAKLEVGSQLTLTATVSPDDATDKYVTWSTTNSGVATVDSLGNVLAVGTGECFIIANCRDNQAMCHIIVVDHFIFITLDEHEVSLLPNHMIVLTPSVMPENTSLTVTSTNPNVAAARLANGKIQVVGITEGRTTIKVNSTDGYAEADSCLIKVYTLRGDVNIDGYVNISDVTSLINHLLGGQDVINEVNADTNNDGKINISDVTRLINYLLGGDELDPKEEPIDGAETFTVNGVSFTMLPVEGGTFTMGATPEQGTSDPWNDERPTHEVTLSTFSIGETEVTQALWQAVMGSNPSEFSGDLNHPVEMVSWDDCQAFIVKLNQMTGRNFRLPTEAEWEYAARGGKKTQGYKYAGSNDINEVAWWDTNAGDGVGPDSPDYGTHPVASKKANELGLYDMSGNVWEWCQDWYGSYSSEAQTNPTGPATGSNRVYRGGSWFNYARNCRVSSRYHWTMNGTNYMGLRLAL